MIQTPLEIVTGYDLRCGGCDEGMTYWPDESYHRCRKCAATVYVTKKPPSGRQYPPMQSVVYFLKHGDRVKIGRTTNLPSRIASLSLEPTCCVLAIKGGPAKEAELHKRFTPYRIHKRREWFDWTEDIARYVAEHQAENVKREALRCFLP